MTLNGVLAVILRFFAEFGSFGPITSKCSKIDLYILRPKCSPKNLVFSDISFMAMFAEVTENERIIDRHLRDIHPILDYDVRLKVSLCSRFDRNRLSALYGFSVRP